MGYSKTRTATKVAVPAVVLMGGSPVVQWVGSLIGVDIPDEMSYQIVIGIFSVAAGIKNWFSNKWRDKK